MWNFLSDLKYAVDAIFRMEQQMGALNDALAGTPEQLDKIITELNNSKGQLDDADRATVDSVRAKIQQIDDMNPDAPEPPV